MKIDSYTQYILIADEGKWLYNQNDNVVSNEVYLGRNASLDDWIEITEQDKQQLNLDIE